MFDRNLITEKMNNKNWTKYRLAKEAGIGQSTIHEILSGKKKNPSTVTLSKIANALSVSVSEFFIDERTIAEEPTEYKVSKFGTRLTALRNEQNISAEELAQNVEISADSIYKLESSELEPNADALLKLADFFNVTTDYLLGRTEKKHVAVKFAEIDGDNYEIGYDRNVYPDGLTHEQVIKILENLKNMGFQLPKGESKDETDK